MPSRDATPDTSTSGPHLSSLTSAHMSNDQRGKWAWCCCGRGAGGPGAAGTAAAAPGVAAAAANLQQAAADLNTAADQLSTAASGVPPAPPPTGKKRQLVLVVVVVLVALTAASTMWMGTNWAYTRYSCNDDPIDTCRKPGDGKSAAPFWGQVEPKKVDAQLQSNV